MRRMWCANQCKEKILFPVLLYSWQHWGEKRQLEGRWSHNANKKRKGGEDI